MSEAVNSLASNLYTMVNARTALTHHHVTYAPLRTYALMHRHVTYAPYARTYLLTHLRTNASHERTHTPQRYVRTDDFFIAKKGSYRFDGTTRAAN